MMLDEERWSDWRKQQQQSPGSTSRASLSSSDSMTIGTDTLRWTTNTGQRHTRHCAWKDVIAHHIIGYYLVTRQQISTIYEYWKYLKKLQPSEKEGEKKYCAEGVVLVRWENMDGCVWFKNEYMNDPAFRLWSVYKEVMCKIVSEV